MWTTGWRSSVWSVLDQPFDLIVIGGGITGAGILREASRAGLRTLLVEQADFSAGTSSRSSKLVHGGFRYLKNFQIGLTIESVRERERLLKQGRGLVTPLGFLMPAYKTDRLPSWMLGLGLIVYDLIALSWSHRYYDSYDLRELCPSLNEQGLRGGYRFFDAQTDDARLVLRVLQEGVLAGGAALNYTKAACLLKSGQPTKVCGVLIQDTLTGQQQEVFAPLVINATGAWADELRLDVGAPARLRRLRGSHLVLPASRLPLSRAVSLWHPRDHRPVFAFPWEGVVLVGTTDVDHGSAALAEPAISCQEMEYLLEAVGFAFPDAGVSAQDVQAAFSGVRPVVFTGKADPSRESREHVLWSENGLLTVTGGKLTTFRPMAVAALRAACRQLPGCPEYHATLSVLDEIDAAWEPHPPATRKERLRLSGRYGKLAAQAAEAALPGEWEKIAGTSYSWAELRWAARAEAVEHLDDLLLRRLRLGLVLPNAGLDCLERIRTIVQPELGWDDLRWQDEVRAYIELYQRCYQLPAV